MATTTMTQSTTETVEMVEPQPVKASSVPDPQPQPVDSQSGKQMDSKMTICVMSAGLAFFVSGVSDGSIGTIIPYAIREYDINTTTMSSVFGANFVGWLAAAATNAYLSEYLDLGAMLALGAVMQILGSALRTFMAPFAFWACTFFFVSLGQAYQDTHCNTFVATVKSPHRWLGFIHAMYALGCLVSPFASNAVASASNPSRWNLFYVVPLGIGVANLGLALYAFWDTFRLKNRSGPPSADQESKSPGANKMMKKALSIPGVWVLSIFYFFYLGAVLTASGWIVEYLVVVRDGDLAKMGYVPAGYNGGTFLGRLLLPEITHRWGERRMVFSYCVLCLAFQLTFWLVPNIISASIAITFFGFFSGPLFAAGMALGAKIFPPESHSTALAFVFVLAQMGGSFFPIVTGVIAASKGVAILQPMLVGLIAATGIAWLLVPRPKSVGNPALHQE
ncbi:hypothetical protein jhhlp_000637 [Lomentospora prolificans]|uniref:Major facilitator superfamily (MFS) profile domain-containing protein n=1 Tax=Lomentospora prolificans TaxID=41688 RepID=A0A2N3NJ55_9PEZI|nr:hypothetical protein jhhlp_000637 [Lomentospora prolificans]